MPNQSADSLYTTAALLLGALVVAVLFFSCLVSTLAAY